MPDRRAFLVAIGTSALASSIPMPRPSAFDAAGYVRDLRRAGHRVYALQDSDGVDYLAIGRSGGLGLGNAYSTVSARWRPAMDADPDHLARVVDFLRAEAA